MKKKFIQIISIIIIFTAPAFVSGQQSKKDLKTSTQHVSNNLKDSLSPAYRNSHLPIIPFRLPPLPVGYKPEYIDFDKKMLKKLISAYYSSDWNSILNK